MEAAAEKEQDQPREPSKDDEARADEAVDLADQSEASTRIGKTGDGEEAEEHSEAPKPSDNTFLATLSSSGRSGYLANEITGSGDSRHDFESQEPFVREIFRFNAGDSGSDREGVDEGTGLFGDLEQDAGSLSGVITNDEASYASPHRHLNLRAAKVGIPYRCFRIRLG